ncbi:MAG: alpha/beta hydrolase [Erysipelothrix sp.]|nr:alpha/beta hydrolase [Erysipelothrix sp.]
MKLKKIILRLLIGVLAIVLLLGAFIIYTPYPASYMMKTLFEGGMAVTPENYEEIEKLVTQHEDIDYDSKYKQGNLDIFTPKDVDTALPVILWVHGGAFIGGDKNDIDEYATQISAKGYVVVNMNYQLAPGAQYPEQIEQMAEVYKFMTQNKDKYRMDLDSLFIAGDSAGAHMAAQFTMVQTDAAYAKDVNIQPVVLKDTIKGTMLLCGPYDLEKLSDLGGGNKVLSFFLDRAAWAYLGKKNWKEDPKLELLSITNHVSKDFPSSFITDGTTGTFTAHGLSLVDKLESLGVSVDAVFYDEAGLELPHEYQFQMDNPQSINTFNRLIEFLNNNS